MNVDPNIVEPRLARENFIVVSALQALSGGLSTNVTAATVEFVGDDVRAHFLFRADRDEDRREVEEEFPSEIEALLLGMIEPVPRIETVVHLSPEREARLPGRLLWRFRD